MRDYPRIHDKQCNIRVTEAELYRLKAIAWRYRTSVSGIIRMIIARLYDEEAARY